MNLKNRIIAMTAAAAIALPAIAIAGKPPKFSPNKNNEAEVTFDVKLKPAGSFTGRTTDVSVSEDGDNYTVKVMLGRVNTQQDGRNKHFQTKLVCQSAGKEDEAGFEDKCKKVSRETKLIVPKSAVADIKKGSSFTGKMMINGKTNDVTVKVDDITDGADNRRIVSASTTIQYQSFGYKEVCNLGICVANDIKIKAKLPIEK